MLATLDSNLLAAVTGGDTTSKLGAGLVAGLAAGGASFAMRRSSLPAAVAARGSIGAGCAAANGEHPLVVAGSSIVGAIPGYGAVTNALQCGYAAYKAAP